MVLMENGNVTVVEKMSEILCVEGLCAWYTQEQPVLKACSLSLREHEVVGLIGLNGAGKTTLLNVLSGLHEKFSVNKVIYAGVPIAFRDVAFKQMRYTVFAEDAAFGYFSFREYLCFVCRAYGCNVPDVTALVEGFHFNAYVEQPIRDLSTGNRKKAFLITAFALRPSLLFLDEPVNGLDFQSTEFLYACINAYRESGTVLFSSHVLESIVLTADRVLILEQGRIGRIFTAGQMDAAAIREALRDDNV